MKETSHKSYTKQDLNNSYKEKKIEKLAHLKTISIKTKLRFLCSLSISI